MMRRTPRTVSTAAMSWGIATVSANSTSKVATTRFLSPSSRFVFDVLGDDADRL
jgi:hypothetical protein